MRCVHACQNWQRPKLWSLCFLPRAWLNIIRLTHPSTEDPNTFAIYYTSHYAHYCGDMLCNWYLTSKVHGTRILPWRPKTLATGNDRQRASITAHAHCRSKAAPHASFFFGVYSWLVKVLGQFSIIYFRGLGLRIGVRVWVRVRVGVRVWVRVRVRVRVRVSVVLWSG